MLSLFLERTKISDEELTQILGDISKEIGTTVQTETGQKEVRENEGAVSGVQSNRMRNLQKKLDQIEALKERVKKGEKLEVNQVTDKWNFGSDACLTFILILNYLCQSQLSCMSSFVFNSPGAGNVM